jgi:hypothetical protein
MEEFPYLKGSLKTLGLVVSSYTVQNTVKY